LSRGIYGDEFQGWNPLQMLKWLQGLLPSRGAAIINRSVHPDFLNFLICVKQPYIHTHSLSHSNEKVSSQSLIHPRSFTCVNGFTYSFFKLKNCLLDLWELNCNSYRKFCRCYLMSMGFCCSLRFYYY
jgi:hypothetical protein